AQLGSQFKLMYTPVGNPWIAAHRSSPHCTIRLFCLPYAGAGASIFRSWSAQLPTQIEVCPVQLPGREERLSEAAFERMEPLIEELSTALNTYVDRPFAFFGHSMGALIAFELARRLQEDRGLCPKRLIVSGRRAPALHRNASPLPAWSDTQILDQ